MTTSIDFIWNLSKCKVWLMRGFIMASFYIYYRKFRSLRSRNLPYILQEICIYLCRVYYIYVKLSNYCLLYTTYINEIPWQFFAAFSNTRGIKARIYLSLFKRIVPQLKIKKILPAIESCLFAPCPIYNF